ncbi:rod shape-determining protein MreD [Thermodesulfobacteriota bacterium]
MSLLFFICLSLSLIVLQTTFLPYLPVFKQFYDLLLPLVLYFGLYRPAREGLIAVFALGLVMDSLSGTPFGLYVTVYFWTFAIVRWGTNYLHVGNQILILIVVAAGIVMENVIFLATLTLLGHTARLPVDVLRNMGLQLLWGVFTGPLLLVGIRFLHGRFDRWFTQLTVAWKDQRG